MAIIDTTPACIVQTGLSFWVMLNVSIFLGVVIIIGIRFALIILLLLTFVILYLLAASCFTFSVDADVNALAFEQVLNHLTVKIRVFKVLMVEVDQIGLKVQVFIIERLGISSLYQHLFCGPTHS